MKIIEVIPHLVAGGAENFLVNLSNEFSGREDCQVAILTLYQDTGEFLRKKVGSNIELISLNKKKGIDWTMPYKVYRVIKDGKFSIAHFHVQAIIYSIFSVLFYRKCKYFATIHSDAYMEASGLHRWVRYFMFRTKLCVPVTISQESQNSFYDLYRTSSELILNGVNSYVPKACIDRSRFVKTPNTKLFVYVASITPSKNQLTFAKCINRLGGEGEDVSLIVLGRITDQNYGSLLMEEESDFVHYIGEVENPTDYMAISDYFVLVSTFEGLPISLLEAFSTGCIPIVTPVGGCKNIIRNNENGFMADSPSFDDVYAATKKALSLSSDEVYELKALLKREFVDNYTIKRCADLYLNLFKR